MADLQDVSPHATEIREIGDLDQPSHAQSQSQPRSPSRPLSPDDVPDAPAPDGPPSDAVPEPAEPLPEPPTPSAQDPAGDPASDPAADRLSRALALLAAHPVADGASGLDGALDRLRWYDLELGESAVASDVPRLLAGGVGAVFWSLTQAGDGARQAPVTTALERIDRIKGVLDRYPESLRLAADASQTADARAHGRIACLLGPAEAPALGDSLGTLRSLHLLGLRVLTLTGTSWAGPDGLSPFGQEVVRELNRLGVLTDLTGASPATVRGTFAVSKAPAILTRSGARALRDHPDNADDALLAELGERGGLCLVPCAVDRTGPELADVADHVDHVARIAGPESVGLSGTYDTGAEHPRGLPDPSGYPALVAELLARGWAEPQLALLTWGNVQRVLRGAEFTARAAQLRRPPAMVTIAELDRG